MNLALKTASIVLAALAFAAYADAAGGATVTGKVSYSGSAQQQKIQMAADPACAQQHSAPVQSQEVAAQGGALQNALVYVKEGAQGDYPAPAAPVVLDQKGCLYEPRVFGIQAGQKLEIRNSDPTLHNVNCQPKLNKRFNIAQPLQGMKMAKSFDQPEVGIPFKCNVHPWMAAYGSVFKHPFYSVTDAGGVFTLDGLPAGEYTVEAWHEKLGTKTLKVVVADGETKSVDFSF